MKKLLGLLCAGAVAAMISSCGLTNPVGAPTITISAIGAINAGTIKNVTGNIKADQAITSVSYSITDANGGAVSTITVTGPTASNTNSMDLSGNNSVVINVSASAASGSYKLKISATASATADASFDFTVNGGSSQLTVTGTNCMIANIAGPEIGSYDLVNNVAVPASGSAGAKDLQDQSQAGQGFAGELGSGNGAVFAAATSTDYTNATTASVKTLANAATASTIAIAANTVFVVKLGNSRGYAIVKIDTYDPNAGTSTAGNLGEATFEYKFTL
jgi:hypothetical protein